MSDAKDAEATRGAQRLDKWLWFARLVKSRTLAAALVSDGKIRVNKTRVEKPSHGIHKGDVITATVHQRVRVLKVLELGERRGPAAAARLLYEDLTEPEPPSPLGSGPVTQGRPDKRARREIAELKRSGG